jgi:hypothetical protein
VAAKFLLDAEKPEIHHTVRSWDYNIMFVRYVMCVFALAVHINSIYGLLST